MQVKVGNVSGILSLFLRPTNKSHSHGKFGRSSTEKQFGSEKYCITKVDDDPPPPLPVYAGHAAEKSGVKHTLPHAAEAAPAGQPYSGKQEAELEHGQLKEPENCGSTHDPTVLD